MINPLESWKMDRNALSVESLDANGGDTAYWLTKTPQERLEAMEFLRVVNYGQDATSARLQRVLRVTQLGKG